MPQYRNKYWDGKIRLFSPATGEVYVGLVDKIASWAKKSEYSLEFENNEFYGSPFEENEMISREGVREYMTKISKYKPRDYQVDAVYDALRYNRKLLISPTASGKSLMIYSVVRYFAEKNKKILLVVPTTSLVEQMYKDFKDYGWNVSQYCHRIYSGREKTNENPGIANYRGIGVSEMVDSINNKRLNRCSGELSLHVLDILDTIIKSSENDKKLQLRSSINEVSYFGEDEISKLLN